MMKGRNCVRCGEFHERRHAYCGDCGSDYMRQWRSLNAVLPWTSTSTPPAAIAEPFPEPPREPNRADPRYVTDLLYLESDTAWEGWIAHDQETDVLDVFACSPDGSMGAHWGAERLQGRDPKRVARRYLIQVPRKPFSAPIRYPEGSSPI
jgi:RNA polymerase subunit RPABC4/transcription elongation factor Spt4